MLVLLAETPPAPAQESRAQAKVTIVAPRGGPTPTGTILAIGSSWQLWVGAALFVISQACTRSAVPTRRACTEPFRRVSWSSS